MQIQFRSLVCFGILLASCDKPPKEVGNGAGESENPLGPAVTKTQRPPPPEAPDPDVELQKSLATARAITPEDERNQAIETIIWNLAETAPARALESLREVPGDGRGRSKLIQHFAMRFAEHDADAAIQWADTLESPEEASAALGKIALVLAETDPVKAAGLISESGIAGRDFDVAVVEVIQQWAAISPPDAAAWVVLFDASEARSAGLQSVLGLWAESDVQTALKWIETLDGEVLIDDARKAMVEATFEQTDDVQAEWMQLANPEIRSLFQEIKNPSPKQNAGDENR
ncbi:MAG: hypothetical protein WEB53_01635 [Akkermansiaceae bacterium]